jgi:hypothetical protein
MAHTLGCLGDEGGPVRMQGGCRKDPCYCETCSDYETASLPPSPVAIDISCRSLHRTHDVLLTLGSARAVRKRARDAAKPPCSPAKDVDDPTVLKLYGLYASKHFTFCVAGQCGPFYIDVAQATGRDADLRSTLRAHCQPGGQTPARRKGSDDEEASSDARSLLDLQHAVPPS